MKLMQRRLNSVSQHSQWALMAIEVWSKQKICEIWCDTRNKMANADWEEELRPSRQTFVERLYVFKGPRSGEASDEVSFVGQTRAGWVTVTGRSNSLLWQFHGFTRSLPFLQPHSPSRFYGSSPLPISLLTSHFSCRPWTFVYLSLIPLITQSLSPDRSLGLGLRLPLPSDADRLPWLSVGTRKWAPDR